VANVINHHCRREARQFPLEVLEARYIDEELHVPTEVVDALRQGLDSLEANTTREYQVDADALDAEPIHAIQLSIGY